MQKLYCAKAFAKRKDLMKCLKETPGVQKHRFDGLCPVEFVYMGRLVVENENVVAELMKTGLFDSIQDYSEPNFDGIKGF